MAHFTTAFRNAPLAGALLLATGCPGSLPDDVLSQIGPDAGEGSGDAGEEAGSDASMRDDAGDATSCPDAPGEVFAPTCVSGCHAADVRLGMLDLESPNLAERLVGVEPAAGTCTDEVLVDPDDPEQSVLLKKLGDDADALCAGALMPLGRQDPFPEDEQRLVRSWIAAGAPDCDGEAPSRDAGMQPSPDAGDDVPQPGEPLPTDGWSIRASVRDADEAPALAIDGDASTTWGSGEPQAAGQWLQIDLGESRSFREIEMDHGERAQTDYPRSYEAYVGNDTADFGEPVAMGSGSPGEATVITLENEVRGRYIRIEQLGSTESSGNWWSVYEVTVRR